MENFYCRSTKIVAYLMEHGIVPYKQIHQDYNNTFVWIFKRSNKLTALLNEWHKTT